MVRNARSVAVAARLRYAADQVAGLYRRRDSWGWIVMRRIFAAAASLAALSFAATAGSQTATAPAAAPTPPQAAPAAPTFLTRSNADQLGDPSCGPARNAADNYYAPAMYPDQNRAPRVSGKQAFKVEVIASHLDHPWALAILPDGKMLVNIRAGGMRIVSQDGTVSEPLAGTPEIKTVFLSAMYDVRLDKDFARNRILYFGYVSRADVGNDAIGRIVRARLSDDDRSLEDSKVIHEAVGFVPRRIVHAPDGTLMITGGEIASGGPNPQSLKSERGKVLRINTDGSIPKDNPYLNNPDADPALYAIGFRDQEGAQIDPATGKLWTVMNGPRGGDELNLIKPGHNYGFPLMSYGRENGGALINGGKTSGEGLEQPVYFWTPSIAPSGLTFYTGKALPGWKGDIFVGAMSGQQLVRLEMKNGRVVGEEKLLRDRCVRFRDVRQGPDGLIYITTDETNGQILRLAPAG